MSDTTNPHPRPSDKSLLDLAYVLANGGTVDLDALSDADARFVWRMVREIVAWRRETRRPQPAPAHEWRLTEDQTWATLDVLGTERKDINRIVVEIMAEPLLQAALWALATMMAVSARATLDRAAVRLEAMEDSIQADLDAPSSPLPEPPEAPEPTIPGGKR